MLQTSRSDTFFSEHHVELVNPSGRSGIVLACEHATNFIPEEFSSLGLGDEVLAGHIAWDPGAREVATAMAGLLDAPLVMPTVSRLVYDCNRSIKAKSAIPERSEDTEVPGNLELSPSERQARADRFYLPYRKALSETIEGVAAVESAPVLISIHTFTPVYQGEIRDLDIGILHDTDRRLADRLLAAIDQEGVLTVRRNMPYGPSDGVTHTLSEHAVPRGLLNAMIEIRNILVVDTEEQHAMAKRLASYIYTALTALGVDLQRQVSS